MLQRLLKFLYALMICGLRFSSGWSLWEKHGPVGLVYMLVGLAGLFVLLFSTTNPITENERLDTRKIQKEE